LSHRTRQLRVSSLARVEGEGGLRLVIDGDRVDEVELAIYEPPRFFEAFLRGRQYTEVLDITARICGICPVAYQTSGWNAIEDACGVTVDGPIAALRRLLYCGEWISSHVLHIYLLHAVDFLGYADAIGLARDHRAEVERGLALKKVGNAVLERVGGRAIHPVNPRIGGFHRAPTRDDLAPLAEQLRRALDQALETVSWVAGFDFPDVEVEHEMVAVHHPDHYAIEAGEVATASGLRIPPSEYLEHAVEHQVPHSTALHATFDGGRYLTGPLARYTINSGQLSPLAREAAVAAGLGDTCRNPFRSIVVRAVETVYAVEEALRIIDSWKGADAPSVTVTPRAGTGYGATEAPRGLLYHRYRLDADGTITDARIVPPTSQNQISIEHDLRAFVQPRLHLPADELTRQCEQAIRNYDPCISCATHFLDLTVEHR
jgi:sulfhydrogenase subunit alpha